MFEKGLKYQITVEMITESCCSCGIVFGMPSDLTERLLKNKGEEFFCPKGHKQWYVGKTDSQKLKEAQEELRKKQAEFWQENEKRLIAEKKAESLDKKLKRVHKGVCPCCNRSFENLRRHMETKHPEELQNYIKLINSPKAENKKQQPVKLESGIVLLNRLTYSERKKLKEGKK